MAKLPLYIFSRPHVGLLHSFSPSTGRHFPLHRAVMDVECVTIAVDEQYEVRRPGPQARRTSTRTSRRPMRAA